MRLLEFASADDLVKLWQIVSQNVFAAVEKERREAEAAQRLEVSKPKRSRAVRSSSRSVSAIKVPTVKAVSPKTVRQKAVKPQLAKPQTAKIQSVPNKKSVQTTPQASTQQSMMPRTVNAQASTQLKQRLPQVPQQPSQQQIAQMNRKLYPNVQPT